MDAPFGDRVPEGGEPTGHAESPTELYLSLCETLIRTGDLAVAWVGTVVDTSVAVAAAAGPAAGSIDRAISLGGGAPIAVAIRETRPVVSRALEGSQGPRPWVEEVRDVRLRSGCALPITLGSRRVGALSVWSYEAGTFDEGYLTTLESLVANVSFALDRFARKAVQAEHTRICRLALATPELGTLLDEVASGVSRTLGGSWCRLRVQVGDGSRVLGAEAGRWTAREAGHTGPAGVVAPGASRACSGHKAPVPGPEQDGPKNLTKVPIQGSRDRLGEIEVAAGARLTDGDELDFLRSVASTVAAAVERAHVEAELDRLAHHDPLTGLPNRKLLLDCLGRAVAPTANSPHEVAVLFVDLDRFKLVNNAFGQSLGDRLLVDVAGRLVSAVGERHMVARIGDDEFAVLCEGVTAIDAAVLARAVAERLSAPVDLGRASIVVTASVGITIARRGAAAEQLLREADAAMSEAKARGGDRYAFFDEGLQVQALHRLELESDLRRGLAAGELCAYYQPVHLLSGGVVGVEALVRWEHPRRGTVAPGEFMTCAEETGLVVPLGAAVLDLACEQLGSWQKLPELQDLWLAVNLSAVQLADPELPATVAGAIARHGITAAALQLEITETALMSEAASGAAILEELRRIGVSVAIDDFGTGYSSLVYLRSFPVDTVKIDRCFVDGIGRNTVDLAIVRSVVELAHALGMATVAEGVERAGQVRALRKLGCDMAQGFYWSPPLRHDEAERVILASRRAARGRGVA